MLHLPEFLCNIRPHTQGWRCRVIHIGVGSLKVLQLTHEHVELHIANDRRVEDIVIVVMFVQLRAQLKYTCSRIHRYIIFYLRRY